MSINWNEFRNDTAVKIFTAMMLNESFSQRIAHPKYGDGMVKEALCIRARTYADSLVKELKEHPFVENK